MRYVKYIKYILCCLVIFALWILCLQLQESKSEIEVLFNVVMMPISTGIIVYVLTAIHLEKIDYYRNERKIINIITDLQMFRNEIHFVNDNRKDIEPERVLEILSKFEGYCEEIIDLFYKAGLVNSRSGRIENILYTILNKLTTKYVLECDCIWSNIANNIRGLRTYKNFIVTYELDGQIMETVNRLSSFLDKNTDLLAVYTVAILYNRKGITSFKAMGKYIRNNPPFPVDIRAEILNDDNKLKEEFQKILQESNSLRVSRRAGEYTKLRNTYRYLYSVNSLYWELMKLYTDKENGKKGYDLYKLYDSLEEKKVLEICIKDLLQNKYLIEKDLGGYKRIYLTDKGKKLAKKCNQKHKKEIYIDLRTGKKIESKKRYEYEHLEIMHIKLKS